MSGLRGTRGGHGRNSYTAKRKGFFEKGVWQCDCNPRLPAVHLQTKKAGANQGRWFYACQKKQEDDDRCKFFLWEDDAKKREEVALMSNSRTEAAPTNTTPARPTPSGPQRALSPPPPRTTEAGTSEPSKKRSRTLADEDDEYGFGQGDEAFDNELDLTMIEAETPRKAARTQHFQTPTRRKLPWDTGMGGNSVVNAIPTPQTERRGPYDLFPTRFSRPGGSLLTPLNLKMKEPEEDSFGSLTPSSSFDTSTPSRSRDARDLAPDLAQNVFKCLRERGVQLGQETESVLASVLKKHAKIAEGLRLGHEASRKEVKAKEAKIAELTLRNNTLQAELEASEAKVQVLTWEMEQQE